MRKEKLLAMLLMLGMALNVFVGCSGGTSAPTTEEVTTTTTVAPTPTPTPEPTATPTPTPPFEKLVIDERLCESSWFSKSNGVYSIWTFNKNNTGYVFSMIHLADGDGYYFQGMKPLYFDYSVISDGVIRLAYSDGRNQDYQYDISKDTMMLKYMDSDTTLICLRHAWMN